MTKLSAVALAASIALASGQVWAAPDAYWNDAVKTGPDGKRSVELPPANPNRSHIRLKPPTSWIPPSPLMTYVMEGPGRLVECLHGYYRTDGTCNDYAPGQYKDPRMRVWIVKRDGQWWQCPSAGEQKGCIVQWPTTAAWLPPARLQP